MADGTTVAIELAYARPDVQRILRIDVPSGTTAREALRCSGLAEIFPEIDPDQAPIGVFGHRVDDGHVVRHGDRLEVYRPLECDPRETRRILAERGLTMGGANPPARRS